MPVIQSKLFQFWQQKEMEFGRRITVIEVSRATKISRETIQRLLDNDSTRFDGATMAGLCEFFSVPAGPIPFLVFEHDGAPE